jgi:hypothetical protein
MKHEILQGCRLSDRVLWFSRYPMVLFAVSGLAVGAKMLASVQAAHATSVTHGQREALQVEVREGCRWGQAERVHKALQQGATLPSKVGNLPTLLHAVEWDDKELARVLLSQGADPRIAGINQHTPLYAAVTSPRIAEADRVWWIHTLHRAGAGASGTDGTVALQNAVRHDQAEVAYALLQAGAHPETLMPPDVNGQQETVLTYAVHQNFNKTMMVLAHAGARR